MLKSSTVNSQAGDHEVPDVLLSLKLAYKSTHN